jgi:WD40 repeat protein
LWNLGSKQLDGALVDLPGQVMGAVGDISFSPDGSILAVITKYNDERNIAFLWDWKNKKSYPLLANTENVVGISFKPNGNLVTATTKNDGSIELRDWQSGQVSQIPQFIREETLLKGIEFSSEHKRVVIFADNESKITSSLWNWENNKLKELKSDESYPYPPTLSFGSNGKLLATTEDNTVSLYSWYSYRNWDNSYSMGFSTESEFKLPQGRVLSMLLSRDGKQLATQGDDGILRLWDLEEPQPPEADFPQAGVESISFSPDHQTIATTDAEGIVRLWDSAGNKLQEFPIPPSKVTSLSFSPDGKQLATGGADGFVRLWDLKGKQLKQFEAHQGNKLGEVTNVSWSRDGRTIATVIDRVVRLWDVNGNELNSKDYPQLVKSISFQPNGELRVVTTGASDNKFNAFKVFLSNNSGKSTVLISESRDWTYIDFNADGSLIATASRENVVLWDLQGRQLMKFKTHEDEIKSISFSADGSKLAVVGKDGKVKLWQLGGLDELLERGCERVRGHLATLDENNSDRHLCDGISSSTPSVQTTTANSSAPSIVQPSAQNAPSPVPSSNKGQDTPSSSAPANAPGRPQNVPSPTPPSNNGKNNYRQAPSDRRQASKLNSVDAYINQGLTYHRQRNYQQAISSYSKGIALNPKSAIAYSYRASAYVGQKDYQKAIADSSKAISLNPTYVNAYINRGVAYYRQGNSKGAIANYNKAIKLAPGNANAYNNRALAYTRLGNQQAAQADKRKAAALSQRQLR